MTGFVAVAAIVSVLPLVMVLVYVLIKGGQLISLQLFTELPPAPGLTGGIGNAVLGTILVTSIAAALAIPTGIGGGIYLAEFSQGGGFAQALKKFVLTKYQKELIQRNVLISLKKEIIQRR